MKTVTFLFIITLCSMGISFGVDASMDTHELWFSETPAMKHPEGHKNSHPDGKKRGGSSGHSGHESEHRPKPLRTYWLNTCGITEDARAYLLRPEGESIPVPIQRKNHEVSVTVNTPFGDGPAHGANNVYLVDQYVDDDTFYVNSAKWLTIHHNCGWGHDNKFNGSRMVPQSFSEIPLEIVVDRLWDPNFHSTVMSGDTIKLQVFTYGKPAKKAMVTIESDKGWTKRITTDDLGMASFQMVRDYYPDSWKLFNREHRGKVRLSAFYSENTPGEYNGEPYEKSLMTSTFSWRYYPARNEYVSYSHGLITVFFVLGLSGLGVFIYRERRKKTYRGLEFHE